VRKEHWLPPDATGIRALVGSSDLDNRVVLSSEVETTQAAAVRTARGLGSSQWKRKNTSNSELCRVRMAHVLGILTAAACADTTLLSLPLYLLPCW